MWSGPRNISTAMMRAFENREDTAVIDEPFYAAYLKLTGTEHPLREKVLETHESDWRKIVDILQGPVPGGCHVFYQKHMAHHMVLDSARDWMASCRNAFLIRSPEAVLASYSSKRSHFLAADIGFETQREMFDHEADRIGTAPRGGLTPTRLAIRARMRSTCGLWMNRISKAMSTTDAEPSESIKAVAVRSRSTASEQRSCTV